MVKKRFFKTKDTCEITFEYNGEHANEAALVADFNDWKPLPMKKAKKAGSPFRVMVRLPKESEYQFRYFVDQQTWQNDEAADAYWANEFGESNSVINTFTGN